MPAYEDIRSQLKTGDLVLFSGKSAISNIIKLFSGGKWSHVGMVLRLPELDDAVLLWESTTLSDIEDVETNLPTKGVQLIPLSQRIAGYAGEVTVRHLNKELTEPMHIELGKKRSALSRCPYEKSEIELIKAAWDGFGGASCGEDLSSVFCSELVAEAYQSMGLLDEYPDGQPSNEYTPIDFSEGRPLKLNLDYALENEIPITP